MKAIKIILCFFLFSFVISDYRIVRPIFTESGTVTIEAVRGEEIAIALDSKSGNGHLWEAVHHNSAKLVFIDTEIQESNTKFLGAPFTQLFIYKVNLTGNVDLLFNYKRFNGITNNYVKVSVNISENVINLN